MKNILGNVILLNKKEGETPLEALESFRKKNKKYKDAERIRMTYAGRLDPMASGLLLVLAGEETKNKEKYLALEKVYEFEVLFGFATDTYDILGKIVRQDLTILPEIKNLEKLVKQNLKFFTGKFVQKYPMYSSKTVAGRQLFEYARAGEEVVVPERQVNVKSLKFLKIRKITSKKLLENIQKRIEKVKGDFRQKEILKIWDKILDTPQEYILKSNLSPLARGANFSRRRAAKGFLKYIPVVRVASFKIKCSSGTYVRGIANSLGEKLGIPALAFSIKRTKIGKYTI